jgi:hypothetical protein
MLYKANILLNMSSMNVFAQDEKFIKKGVPHIEDQV